MCVVDEFVLTTVLLFLVVTIVRWLRGPDSPLFISDLDVALAVIGVLSGAVLTGLILTPLGRRSGGHMNPAVTIALWVMDAFPGRTVGPYVLAQLAGSVAGTALARAAWGTAVSRPSIAHAVVRPAPDWEATAVLLAEVGAMAAVILVVAHLLAHPRVTFLVPYVIGFAIATVISLLGPLSGGCINPARQLGPAALSGETKDLWIYLIGPVIGAVIGAAVYHLFSWRFDAHRPRTYKLGGDGTPGQGT